MLLAQATAERLTLVSVDTRFPAYDGVDLLPLTGQLASLVSCCT